MAQVKCANCGGTMNIEVQGGDACWTFASAADFAAAGGPSAGGWGLMAASQRPTGANGVTLPSPAVALPNHPDGKTCVCHVPPCPGSVAGGV